MTQSSHVFVLQLNKETMPKSDSLPITILLLLLSIATNEYKEDFPPAAEAADALSTPSGNGTKTGQKHAP